MLVKYKKDSFELYQHLLRIHDFYWRATEDHRYIDKHIEEENEIERLRKIHDQRNELYNSYSPYKK